MSVFFKVSTYLSCFDFNKFVGMPDEHALEVEGIKLISENKLWAGLVFVDFPTAEGSNDRYFLLRIELLYFSTVQ